MKRRTFLTAMSGAATTGLAAALLRTRDEGSLRAQVFIGKASSYQADLESVLRIGLRELGVGPSRIRARSVLLKPNLVEPCGGAPQINTHPAVIRAAASVFRS